MGVFSVRTGAMLGQLQKVAFTGAVYGLTTFRNHENRQVLVTANGDSSATRLILRDIGG